MPDRAEVEADASKNNAELKSALAALHASEAEVVSARAAYLPDLGLNFTYGVDAPQLAVNGPDASRNLGYSASATLDIPVWDWLSTEHKVKQSEIHRDLAKVALTTAQRRLIANLSEFYDEAATARDQLASLDASVDRGAGESSSHRAALYRRRRLGARSRRCTEHPARRRDRAGRWRRSLSACAGQSSDTDGKVLMTRMSRNRLKCAAAALACGLMLAGCKQADTTPQVVVTVQAAKPVVAPISEQIQGDAILSPLAEAALSPKISAPVKKFYVQRGAHVRAGQLLVTLEDRDLQAAALDNQGAYTAAQATYQQATGHAAARSDPGGAARSRAGQGKSRAQSEHREGPHPALSAGRDSGPRSRHREGRAGAGAGRLRHRRSSICTRLKSVGSAASGQVAQGDLTSAKGKYLNAEALASYASLHSPIDGVVTDRPLFAGEMAPAGTPLITVMDTTSLIAKLHLSQAVTQRMKVGDKAEVTVPGMSDPIEGSVSLISPALDPGSTTVEVWVKLKNPDGQLKAGTPVHVAIVGRTVPNALQVPSSALHHQRRWNARRDGRRQRWHRAHEACNGRHSPSGHRADPQRHRHRTIVVIDTGGYGLQDGTKVKIGAAGDDKSADEGKD